MDRRQRDGISDPRRRRQQVPGRRPPGVQNANAHHHGRDDPRRVRGREKEKRTMSTTTKRNHKAAPTTFDALIGELMPTAIHDKGAYGNATEMVRRLAVVPA